MLNHDLHDEISEHVWDPREQHLAAEGADDLEQGPSKRGAKKVPEQWTRVINVQDDDPGQIRAYVLATDLLVIDGFQPLPEAANSPPWKPVFLSKDFVLEHPALNIADY